MDVVMQGKGFIEYIGVVLLQVLAMFDFFIGEVSGILGIYLVVKSIVFFNLVYSKYFI